MQNLVCKSLNPSMHEVGCFCDLLIVLCHFKVKFPPTSKLFYEMRVF